MLLQVVFGWHVSFFQRGRSSLGQRRSPRSLRSSPCCSLSSLSSLSCSPGVDPGKCTIMHFAVPTEGGKFKSIGLSSAQYQRESGMLIARKKSLRWNKRVKPQLTALQTVSTKGLSMHGFLQYMEVYEDVGDALWREYTKPRWARQRMRLYSGKKRVFSNFFKRLDKTVEPCKRLVVAYGNAKFGSGNMPGKHDVPTSRAYKECASRYLTYQVDEFRTSRVDAETETVLTSVCRKENRTAGIQKSVRGLLWCESTNDNRSKFVNRDLNAAINIRRCLLLPTRPPALERGQPRLQARIGMWI